MHACHQARHIFTTDIAHRSDMLRLTSIAICALALMSAPAIADPASEPYSDFLTRAKSSPRTADALFNYINSDMPAYWDDTGWDFNGISRTPGEGDIACGYFVTTPLKDLGVPLQRVRLAQAASSTMIKELTVNRKITATLPKMLAHIEAQGTGQVHIVGLDFHTGFITRDENGIWFIHSNYIDREGVVRERAETSQALNASGYFMVGNLTANDDFIRKWAAN